MAPASGSTPTAGLLEAIFNHLTLPPCLPGYQDPRIDLIASSLTDRLLDAVKKFSRFPDDEFKYFLQFESLRRSLETCKHVNANGRLSRTSLSAAFRDLHNQDFILVHVVEQNVALIIRRQPGDESVLFEVFEASPLSEAVLASQNALQWDFPGSAVAIPLAVFNDTSFQNQLATFLEKAGSEPIGRFSVRTIKNDTSVFESRNTPDPALISQMLMSLLEANGVRSFPKVLRKRVRDDVSYSQGGGDSKPWRRCPFWLVLRVAVQSHLSLTLDGEIGRVYYKFLICCVLGQFLDECLSQLSLELSALLKTKICRRLVKLELDRKQGSQSEKLHTEYGYLFAILGPELSRCTQSATKFIHNSWERYKKTIIRPVHLLPKRADIRHLNLSLLNSELYLKSIFIQNPQRNPAPQNLLPEQLPKNYQNQTAKPGSKFATCYFELAKQEENNENCNSLFFLGATNKTERCLNIAARIEGYMNQVNANNSYDENPEQKSSMLLSIMEMWVEMDSCATGLFGPLTKYSPVFPSNILDVLQLPRRKDLIRVQKVRKYLQERHSACEGSHMTIFSDPESGCFSEVFYDHPFYGPELQELKIEIEEEAEYKREEKEEEWRKMSSEFEDLTAQAAEASCIFVTDQFQVKRHVDKDCFKCYLERKLRRFKIKRHEHPLSALPVQFKTAIFEMACPEAFARYRETTWRILSTLGLPDQTQAERPNFIPRVLLPQYTELSSYQSSMPKAFCLASNEKSFLSSHYRDLRFPVLLEAVCLPNPLKLRYFDTKLNIFPSQLLQGQKITFAHHCQLVIPATSPFYSLSLSPEFTADSRGRSSYEIIASQTKCPAGLNVHEFLSFQGLFSGKSRRWLQIFIELASSNINFSTEAVTNLMRILVLQVGPGENNNPLGIVHDVFQDEPFCLALLEQLDQRLDVISSNWRETLCMETLITTAIRIYELSTSCSRRAIVFLERVRAVTSEWISALQNEIFTAMDVETSQRNSRYAFWVAMLCRRTFVVYLEDEVLLTSEALCCFIISSITLQNNLSGDPILLDLQLRNALIRDLKLVYNMRHILRKALLEDPHAIGLAIRTIWPDVGGVQQREFTEFEFLEGPDKWWVRIIIRATSHTMPQTVHFNILEGHLLVMGKPIGMLPPAYRTSPAFQQLFGIQSPLIYPSPMPGMSYVVAVDMNGHQVHLGFRNGRLIARAILLGTNICLEHIPIETFGTPGYSDLPDALVEDCIHWIDLKTGIIDIRRRSHMWRAKTFYSNWRLNFYTRQATGRGQCTLVDPYSPLFQRVASLFQHFEWRQHLTVFQPPRGKLTVELTRLGLTFFVNGNNLLESPQLRSQIDPNQDAGTWYGLQSKLVLREVIRVKTGSSTASIPQRKRSILVPMGEIKNVSRNGPHVTTFVDNNGDIGKFVINDILGRLECAPEPRLLYLKAMYHAYTSFVLPDELTGRTGTEEAICILTSGCCQPWTPITVGQDRGLQHLASLTPKREYYPSHLKVLQNTHWNLDLTTSIQHDGFRSIVEALRRKSEQLSAFSQNKIELPELSLTGDYHLTMRSHYRRRIYERDNSVSSPSDTIPDQIYRSRDVLQKNHSRLNVDEIVKLIRAWPGRLQTTKNLAVELQQWTTIGGYVGSFSKVLLTDILESQIAIDWGSIVKMCIAVDSKDMYQLMFTFGMLSFRKDANMNVLRTLVAFATLPELKITCPPNWPIYSFFRQNEVPQLTYLAKLMKSCLVPYPGDDREILGDMIGWKQRKKFELAESAHRKQQEKDSMILGEHLLKQWPCAEPSIEGFSTPVLVKIAEALEIIRPEWLRLFQNLEHSQYLAHVQTVLDRHRSDSNTKPFTEELKEQEFYPSRLRGNEIPKLSDLICNSSHHVELKLRQSRGTGTVFSFPNEPNAIGRQQPIDSTEILELEKIAKNFALSKSAIQKHYGQDLAGSLEAFKHCHDTTQYHQPPAINNVRLSEEISKAQTVVKEIIGSLNQFFEHGESYHWLKLGGLWPAVTSVTLLEMLRSKESSHLVFGRSMKEGILHYALSITHLQRLLRIHDAVLNKNKRGLLDEQLNLGHTNWKPHERPDWLLLEIDSNILIREGQVGVALATISPLSNSNSVLQMNMGQGKTSCIMPMAAAVLADGKNLMRIVVPKALLHQTAQLLHARLGGLLGRELRHVPFSRRTPTSEENIKQFFGIHQSIRKSSGIMLCLPDHILSFKLSGLQRLADSKIPEASMMIKVQNWLSKNSRDILDECDNILALRTQLIYPSGSQKTVDGHPQRWEIAENLLARVDGHLVNLQKAYPGSIEVIRRLTGGFPLVFFLRKNVEDELIARLVDDIYRGRTSIFPECSKSDRVAMKSFISEAKVSPKVTETIKQMFPDRPVLKQAVYLLRGLLVHRILLMTLKKRWNVQYGLHPARDPIAVPYHAKGTPSDQAEWGHPDVAILFTCLSFYYDGLQLGHLRQALGHILKSDDPSQIYDRFSQNSTLPDSLREWNSVNVDDEGQLKDIWSHIRYNIHIIDYFLNNFVFPRHARQFQVKLQASGWDIPLMKNDMSTSDKPQPTILTTGFSGTNDWKGMLPLTVCQRDIPSLAHTNAEVLTYLLQNRNRRYERAQNIFGKHISEEDLLRKVHKCGIKVFIDAGAQILEMDNLALVKAWMEIDTNAPAAVYFDDSNKPLVYYRNSRSKIPLLASTYADNLGDCLVYLDEAHTRGTDLKFPPDARGALTLGLGQTKDHTVQAAMRLRQLGTTQSITFFAPPEVTQSIVDLQKKPPHLIDSYDVICWLLQQTCNGIEQLQPLYYSQGIDFCRRMQAALDHCDFIEDSGQREQYMGSLRQVEQQTLEQLYGPSTTTKDATDLSKFSPAIRDFMKMLNTQRKGFQDTGNAVHGSALQEVEQEREVAYEVEAIREVQKPNHYPAHGYPGLHRDIIGFINTGRLAADSAAYKPAFVALAETALGRKHRIYPDATSSQLYVTTEFTKTIATNSTKTRECDPFQRPVNWILFSPISDIAIIVIPEEAEKLILTLKQRTTSPVYLLTFAAPVTRKMIHFNNLQFYSIPRLPQEWKAPSWLKVELGIYAGRLYFEYDEYKNILSYLEVEEQTGRIREADDSEEESDVMKGSANINTEGKKLSQKPLAFLQDWLAIRRKGQDFTQSPMGFICGGKVLTESHAFFMKQKDPNRKQLNIRKVGAVVEEEDEEDEGGGACDWEEDGEGADSEEDNFDDRELVDLEVESGSSRPGSGTQSS